MRYMGCDIYSYLEYRDRDTWKPIRMQVAYTDFTGEEKTREVFPFDERNYQLFGILAGVRYCPADPIVDPRGLPSDVSPYIKEKYDKDMNDYGSFHSASWYTLYELRLAARDAVRYDEQERGLIKQVIHNIEFMISSAWAYVDDIDVRFVFWFDN